ncbi:MAG: 3-hydroxyanthranilate 3,4-dioxygenase [Crocinitomicaceae bacterium]|jgi:3-hydroxyanthranilate 3,4-dioxygenase|nr:3-hydroxyanthranilate 3,4-dioxygenase [Crocinitomicaceae bacterium]
MMMPFNLQAWIDENRDLLKPPIGNKNLYKQAGDFIVMIVGGPNARKDYHFNESEELFYQVEGDIMVRVQLDGKAQEIHIKEGDIFLLPGKIPHSPIRGANTVGLVIERVRQGTDMVDGLHWYCEKCNYPLKQYEFKLENIEHDFISRFREFYSSEDMRTCKSCGHVMEVDERFV